VGQIHTASSILFYLVNAPIIFFFRLLYNYYYSFDSQCFEPFSPTLLWWFAWLLCQLPCSNILPEIHFIISYLQGHHSATEFHDTIHYFASTK
jgi:hypothetical protein